MRTYFYYYRDEGNVPLVTVCLIKWTKVVCRGMAICSPLDYPEKKEGRIKAKGRAFAAYKNKKTTMPVLREEAEMVLDKTPAPWVISYKSEYKPDLTPFEMDLLAKA